MGSDATDSMTTHAQHRFRWSHRSRWQSRLRRILGAVVLFVSSLICFWLLVRSCEPTI